MKPTATHLALAFTLLLNVPAWAQEPAAEPSHLLTLPQAALLCLAVTFCLAALALVLQQGIERRKAAQQKEDTTARLAHTARLEALLERIATALEQPKPKGE